MITVTKGYCYNPRWIGLIGPVPIAIALSWGILIYCSHILISETNLPVLTASLFQAFFTVFLDFILDPVAVRYSLWTWKIDIENNLPIFTQDYYGIPWGNYWGWHWAIFSYTLVYQIAFQFLQAREPKMNQAEEDRDLFWVSIIIGMGVAFPIIMFFGKYEAVFSSSSAQALVIVTMFVLEIGLVLHKRVQFVQMVPRIPRIVLSLYYLLFTGMWVTLAPEIPSLIGAVVLTGGLYFYVIYWLPTRQKTLEEEAHQ